MKKQLFILIFLLSESLVSSAQITFQKTYTATGISASSCLSVEATSDSGFIFSGLRTIIPTVDIDAYITKTNSSGDVEWSQALGGLRTENIYSVKQTTDGGYVIAGLCRSFSVDSLNEFYLLRLSPAGYVVWEKIYGPLAGGGELGAHCIRQTSDGGFIIGGYEDIPNYGMLYLKTDSSGIVSWGKFVSGSIGTYGVQSIQQTADGGYIITGNEGKLFKTDTAGNIIWGKSYINGAMSFSAQETSDGGYMLAGETNLIGSGGIDLFLIKTDSSGNALWCKTYGGALDENLRNARQTSDGGYLLTGSTNSFGAGSTDIYVVKTDPAGSLLWSKTYGGAGDELGFSAGEVSAGGFIVGGFTSSFGTGSSSAYLIKTDANGTSGCNESTPLTLVTSPVVSAVVLSETATTYIPDTYMPVSTIGAGLVEGLLCSNVQTTIAEVSGAEHNISIAPNPATNYFTVRFDKIINKGEIEFFDVLGARIFSEKINNETQKVITLTHIPVGIYFVKVHDGEKQDCRKMIVEPH